MFGITLAKKAVQNGISLVVAVNNTAIKLVGIGEKINEVETKFTKYFGVATGVAGFGKGASDIAVALVCNDRICAVVSGVGCAADTLQMVSSFIPGPNITTYLTAPVSIGCKTFVWCCKRSELPWGSCN